MNQITNHLEKTRQQSALEEMAVRLAENPLPKKRNARQLEMERKAVVLLSESDEILRTQLISIDAIGYPTMKIRKTHIRVHRVVLFRMLGRMLTKEDICDHINGNKLDARRENLRLVTHSENQRNRHNKRVGKSRFIGVGWAKTNKCWRAVLRRKEGGKDITLYYGYFKTETEAALAYNAAAERFGFYTRNQI